MTAPTLIATEGAPLVRQRRLGWPQWCLVIAAGLILLSLVRMITGAQDITSSGAVRAALQAAVPIGMAGLGGLWSERAGIVNIGLEGMLILGTWFGAWAGIEVNAWAGLLFAVFGGALGGLLHAVATVTFNVDHIVSGVAITILATGAVRYLSGLTFAKKPGGSATQSSAVPGFNRWFPNGWNFLQNIEGKHWFLLSDLAGFIGGIFTDVSPVTVIAIVLIPVSYVVLFRTPFGLRLRSCGENPHAAESLGVNVYLYKYIGVIVSGGLAGLGGAFLSMVASSNYRQGQTGGRGYIGLASMIFGNWRPAGLASGALLFGYTDALQLRGGGTSVHGLLLLVSVLLVAVCGWHFVRGRMRAGVITGVVAALVLWWYLVTDTVPTQFVQAVPHVTTLVVLALAAQRLRPPAADGLPYRKGTG
jgi:simple sugar transport system permease protein